MFELYKVRNPWGTEVAYSGRFNDNDAIWNNQDYVR